MTRRAERPVRELGAKPSGLKQGGAERRESCMELGLGSGRVTARAGAADTYAFQDAARARVAVMTGSAPDVERLA